MQNNIREPHCPLCGQSDQVSFAFQRGGNSIHSCKRCDLEFLFPQPADDTLSSIYSSSYFLGSKDADSVQRQQALKRATAKLYMDTIAPFVRADKPRLLEIGCGSGDFLIEAQSRGFKVEGLEYSEHAASGANTRLGYRVVRVGSLEKECLPASEYDVIGAFDVIEHLRNPAESLSYLSAALKPSGLLVIVTPSLNSWSRRLLGRHWMEYKTEHLTYFSQKSLTRLFRATGFDTIEFYPNYKILSLDYVSSHFERFPVPVISPMVQLFRAILPKKLVHRPTKIVASGIIAIARRAAK
jgi:2-polyprenyl-3-methyl-5-hydroxy-6-metoxy-1,4-benzoquinol methylase